jgi:hypothetical protein
MDLMSARASRPLDPSDIAAASGLDLVAISLFASLPAITGLLLLGLVGRILAIVAVGGVAFRVAGVWRFRSGSLPSVLPKWFRRTLLILTAMELAAAFATLAFLIATPPIGPSRVWWLSAAAAWMLTAAGSIAGIGLACGRLGRHAGSNWASIAGWITTSLGVGAGVAAAGLAGVVIWNVLGTVSPAALRRSDGDLDRDRRPAAPPRSASRDRHPDAPPGDARRRRPAAARTGETADPPRPSLTGTLRRRTQTPQDRSRDRAPPPC